MKCRPFFLESSFLSFQGTFEFLELGGIQLAVFGGPEKISPLKAPFGGFYFPETASRESFIQFLLHLDEIACLRKWTSIEIRLPSRLYYDGQEAGFDKELQSAGFHLIHEDLNFHLPADRPVRQHFHKSERWKLNKLLRKGFKFGINHKPDWSILYPYLLKSRIRKGYSLSMTENELKNSYEAFPERYRTWEVKSPGNELAAFATSVRVCKDIEYVFYTADDEKFRNYSPVVLLLAGVYENLRREAGDCAILDLGTASIQGNLLDGLAGFKRALGGMETSKAVLRKVWHKPE